MYRGEISKWSKILTQYSDPQDCRALSLRNKEETKMKKQKRKEEQQQRRRREKKKKVMMVKMLVIMMVVIVMMKKRKEKEKKKKGRKYYYWLVQVSLCQKVSSGTPCCFENVFFSFYTHLFNFDLLVV